MHFWYFQPFSHNSLVILMQNWFKFAVKSLQNNFVDMEARCMFLTEIKRFFKFHNRNTNTMSPLQFLHKYLNFYIFAFCASTFKPLICKGTNIEVIKFFMHPGRPFIHLTVCFWFLISSGWGWGGVGGGEVRGPSWRGRIRRVEWENKRVEQGD